MTNYEVGRLLPAEIGIKLPLDAPEKTVAALLSKVDELTDALTALCVKLDADSGVNNTNYAAVISTPILKLQFYV